MAEKELRLYLVRFDGDDDPVEATGMSAAIELWKDRMQRTDPDEPREYWEPEQVQEICDGPVIRAATLPGLTIQETEHFMAVLLGRELTTPEREGLQVDLQRLLDVTP